MDKIRVIRVLEYVGERKWVEALLAQRGIKGTRVIENGGIIREAIVGDFPEIVEEETEVITRDEVSDRHGVFMRRFGWEVTKIHGRWIKRDPTTGKVLAHEGDETWTRDLKVAGE